MLRQRMPTLIEKIWYKNSPFRWILVPFSWIYQAACVLRRVMLTQFFQQHFSVPVIVVGNITVGGVGKTPLVIALANALTAKGLKVGIVSRGYGAKIRTFPHEVQKNSQANLVGDEPLLIAKRTECPLIIDPKRVRAIDYLVKQHPIDVILSDDGLQHYAMGRAIEIVVVDGQRGFGNGWCLPAGPLREPPKRITRSDFIVLNGEGNEPVLSGGFIPQYAMQLQPEFLFNMVTGEACRIDSITSTVAAVAAIGNPHRFFTTLKSQGLTIKEYAFPDHYFYKPEDLNFLESIVIMTEKDAVKCLKFARENWFYLPVSAKLPDSFWHSLYSHSQLKRLINV